jgi:hypothetical protein
VSAQDSASRRELFTPMIQIGTAAEDRARLDQLRGTRSTAGWLVRTSSSMTDQGTGWSIRVPGACAARVGIIPPSAMFTWNSDIPFERNDAGVWSGRGPTAVLSAGASVRCGRLTFQAMPEISRAWNDDFYVLPSGYWRRSDFASPFHSIDQSSADLPLRFGTRPVTAFQPGQSAIIVDFGAATMGVSTESEWWGPGIRNALLMSNNAAGIPRWFVGTGRPVRTRAGALSARLITGTLTESRYFDRLEVGTARPLSGAVVTLAAASDSNLTVGAARVVYQRRARSQALPLHALDVLTVWSTRSPGDSAEQLTSFFGRWVFPRSGMEVYGEWARVLLPTSLREMLVAPQHSQGYTVGLQWLSARDPGRGAWRTQMEFTNLEQLRRVREESPPSFYTSPVVPQGYTQRGQVIGATIGPGSSSQFLAVDRVAPDWTGGVFAGRIRWDHDEFYPRPSGLSFYAHDVSLYGGIRATRRLPYADVAGELLTETRMNYLFQHANYGFGSDPTFDVRNLSLRVAVTPAASARRGR